MRAIPPEAILLFQAAVLRYIRARVGPASPRIAIRANLWSLRANGWSSSLSLLMRLLSRRQVSDHHSPKRSGDGPFGQVSSEFVLEGLSRLQRWIEFQAHTVVGAPPVLAETLSALRKPRLPARHDLAVPI